ncbi:MAG: hypothetical protein WCF16_12500 [Alphaproteobacteria bacterium]
MARKSGSDDQTTVHDKIVPDVIADVVAVPVGHEFMAAGDIVADGIPGQALTFDTEDVEDQMVLSLSDLLPDTNGDVVLFNEAGPLAVNIMTDARIMETGTADHYVTSTGVDVSGYHYCTFEAGVTIYYPPEIDLLVTANS